MKHKSIHLLFIVVVFASIALATEDAALIAFRNCLQTNGSTECTLAPKTGGYTVESMINVTNTNLQSIRGTGVTPPDTTLRRGNTSMLSIMRIYVPGVTITDLQFDGNKSLFPPTPLPSGHADLGLYAANITVHWVHFINATQFAIHLTTFANGATIEYGTFKYSRDAGLFAQSDQLAYNIYSNVFRENGGSAIAVDTQADSSARAYIQANEIVGNYIIPVVGIPIYGGIPGGQIVVGVGAENCSILNNFIDGDYKYGQLPSPYSAQFVHGIEIYGSGHVIEGNYVRRHTGPGIHAVGLTNSLISGGSNYWEIRENYFDGIALINLSAVQMTTSNVTVSGIRSNYNGWNGIHLDSNGYGEITGVVISYPESLSGNGDSQICKPTYIPETIHVTVIPSASWPVEVCKIH